MGVEERDGWYVGVFAETRERLGAGKQEMRGCQGSNTEGENSEGSNKRDKGETKG